MICDGKGASEILLPFGDPDHILTKEIRSVQTEILDDNFLP